LHASCLHYGGIAFEGLKAYEWEDGDVPLLMHLTMQNA